MSNVEYCTPQVTLESFPMQQPFACTNCAMAESLTWQSWLSKLWPMRLPRVIDSSPQNWSTQLRRVTRRLRELPRLPLQPKAATLTIHPKHDDR
jgi:hypothetical protein